jgi:hypothetical protein
MIPIPGRYRKLGVLMLVLNVFTFMLIASGLLVRGSRIEGPIGWILGNIPVGLFAICMGMIFYGMLNALKYKWFLVLQLFSILLSWTNVYIMMMVAARF